VLGLVRLGVQQSHGGVVAQQLEINKLLLMLACIGSVFNCL
jgi:hypothetical protein